MTVLNVNQLTKKYGVGESEVVALDNVSFSVQKGEFIAIVGASGSGKSTLLHLIGGVDRPTSGKVYIDGKDIYKFDDDKYSISPVLFSPKDFTIIIGKLSLLANTFALTVFDLLSLSFLS